MSDVVIRVDNLSKKYRIRHQRAERYTALRDVIADKVRSVFRPGRRGVPVLPEVEDFWALKDVSFEVKRGEVVGIIGRNGAGKSTLLKILSRITEPTEGRAELDGRVASLLEVGTGFHPDLTGRENIYLNGAILGMARVEIKRKFDEIVAFAEIEKFLDTPVKRYSSGMYVRLAFAVAAHLEPEILIIDEVLAVGDAEFQKKCLGKIQDVARQGSRTVLFVSHNMTAVSALCDRGVFINAGKVSRAGSVAEAIGEYLGAMEMSGSGSWIGPAGDEIVQVQGARVRSGNTASVLSHQPISIELDLTVKRPVYGLIVGWEVWSSREQLLAYSVADDTQPPPGATTAPGDYRFVLEIPPDTLSAGSYRLCLDLGIHNQRHIVPEKLVTLRIDVENVEGIGRRYPHEKWANLFRPRWRWSVAGIPSQRSE